MPLSLQFFVNHVMQLWLVDFSFSEQNSKVFLICLIIEVSVSVDVGLNTDPYQNLIRPNTIDFQAKKPDIRLFTINTFKYVYSSL